MPSLEHEELVELFVRDLSLAIKLTQATGKVQIPDYDTLEAGPAEVRELVPTSLRVDAVLLLRESEPVMVILVEVQLGRNEDKPYSWPFYVAGARLRYRCLVVLLVYDKLRANSHNSLPAMVRAPLRPLATSRRRSAVRAVARRATCAMSAPCCRPITSADASLPRVHDATRTCRATILLRAAISPGNYPRNWSGSPSSGSIG